MGHEEEPFKVPHYSVFKVKGVPQLEQLQQALAKKGLKDPWIRNEAWRYDPAFGTRGTRAKAFFTRGMPAGIVLAAIVAGFGYFVGGGDHHDHHGDSKGH